MTASLRSRLLQRARLGMAQAEKTFQRLTTAEHPAEQPLPSRAREAFGRLVGELRPVQAAEATVFLTDLAARSMASAQAVAPLVPSMLKHLDPICWSYLHSAALMVHARSPGLTPGFVRTAAEQAVKLPPALRARYLARVLRGAHIDPALANALAAQLPPLLEHLPEQALDGFLRSGFSLWKSNAERAQAFFRLESRASQEALGALRQGLPLEQVRRSLQLYAQSLAGYAVPLRTLADAPADASRVPRASGQEGTAPATLPRAFTDGRTLFLPSELAVFAEREENFRLFKAMTALEVGRLAFGSFQPGAKSDTSPPRPSPDQGRAQAEGARILLEALNQLPSPEAGRALFDLLESYRIEQRLRLEFPGLRPDLDRLTQQGLLNRPLPAELPPFGGLLEALVHALSATPLPETLLPAYLVTPLHALVERTALLAAPEASVRTTLEITRETLFHLRDAGLLHFQDAQAPEPPESPPPDEEGAPTEEDGSDEALPEGAEEAEQEGLGGHGSSPSAGPPEDGPSAGAGAGAFEPLPHQSRLHLELAADLEAAAREALRDWSLALEGDQSTSREEATETPGIPQPDLHATPVTGARDLVKPGSAPSRPILQRSYPEWDSWIEDYKDGWTQVIEEGLPESSGAFAADTLATHGGLVHRLKRQFQRIRKEELERLNRQDDGDEVDIDAAVEALSDLYAGLTPSDRVYTRRVKSVRDVAVAFLVDMSSSTQQLVHGTGRSILDIEKESLLLMAEALESLGDAYAIYGFSGYGRARVSFYVAKDFHERYDGRVKNRISGMSGRLENRDGAAIRHATQKLVSHPARVRLLILLSDGRPLDCGCRQYFERYAQEDTRMALQEARRQQVHPFCITVDRQAQRYLSQMYSQVQYAIIDQVSALPERLPLIYRRLTT